MNTEIEIPEGVNIKIDGKSIEVNGKEGSAKRTFTSNLVKMKSEGNKILLDTVNERRNSSAEMNTIKKHIQNIINGVQNKYSYELRVIYSHFPITINLKGNELHVNNFVGEKEPRVVKIMDGVEAKLKGKDIIVSSVDKEKAGIVAGLIEKSTIVKSRDRRVFQDGIYIVKKGVQNE